MIARSILKRWLCLGFILSMFAGLNLGISEDQTTKISANRVIHYFSIERAEAADTAETKPTNETPESTHGFNVFNNLRIDQGPGVQGSTSLAENIRESAKEQNVDIITALIFRAINILMLTIGTAGFVVLFINGVKLVTNNGDEGAIDSAKGAIVPTLIGLIITFLAYYIVTFFQSLFYSI